MSDYDTCVWAPDLDLTSFYNECQRRGFHNNSSQSILIDAFRRERDFCAWILYYKGDPIGSVVAHTLDLFDGRSFRIAARACVLTDKTDRASVRTLRQIEQHQNHTAQFLLPACIEWAGRDSDMYISTSERDVASQVSMHRICMPAFQKHGMVDFVGDVLYRNQKQSFWKLNVDTFYQQLNANPRW